MPKRGCDADSRIFFDELVNVGVSRLKATGLIRLEDQWAHIPFGEQTKLIGVAHTKFPNGGSWAYFRCPKCGARSKKLWPVDDAPRCRLCLEKLGVRYRAAYGFGRTERLRERDRRVDRLRCSRGEVISSTRIRDLIAKGDELGAQSLLGWHTPAPARTAIVRSAFSGRAAADNERVDLAAA